MRRCRERIREIESDPFVVDIFDRVFAANGVVGLIDGPIDTLTIDRLFHTSSKGMDFPYSTNSSLPLSVLQAAAKRVCVSIHLFLDLFCLPA